MKKLIISMVIIIAVGALVAGIGCAVYFKGNNRLFSKDAEYKVASYISPSSFTEMDLELCSGHRLILQYGDGYSLTYSDSLLSKFNVETKDGKLNVKEKSNSLKWWNRIMYRQETTDIILTVPEGSKLSLRGTISGSLSAELPDWEYGDFDLIIAGSTSITGKNITADDINVTASGSAKFGVGGTLKSVNVIASGSADIELSGSATSLKASVSGSVDLSCEQFDCPIIDVDSSGSSDISLSGTGSKLTVHSSGSTDIYAKDFSLLTAAIHSSGSCDAEINVSVKLTVSVSGSADIKYWGNPSIENIGSNRARIKKMD